jgi:hypothetical protein
MPPPPPPDGGDAGEVQQQPGGPRHRADPSALRGEAEERGSPPQDAAAQCCAQACPGIGTLKIRHGLSLKELSHEIGSGHA